jgi:undecaprenyl-diphosphatase
VTSETALSPAFPSAHATGAAAVYGFVAYAIIRDALSARQRFEVAYWSMVLIALVSFSRIFLGVHFASDVAAGLLVGSFWLLVAFTLAEYLRQRGTPG